MKSKPPETVYGRHLASAHLTLWVPILVACALSVPIVIFMGLGALLK